MEGKIALVTGASRGIGSAIAQKLAAAGATVIVNYSGSEAKAQEVVEKIKAAGGNAVAMKCDVSDFGACKELADAILKEFGRLDILVNNAGITKDGLIMKMTESDFDQVIAINLKGTFNMIQNFSRTFLKQRSGKIINICSEPNSASFLLSNRVKNVFSNREENACFASKTILPSNCFSLSDKGKVFFLKKSIAGDKH